MLRGALVVVVLVTAGAGCEDDETEPTAPTGPPATRGATVAPADATIPTLDLSGRGLEYRDP